MQARVEKEREVILSKADRRKRGRKFFILLSLVLFMGFVIISIVSAFLGKQQLYWQWSNQEYNIGGTELTIFGWSMLSIGVLCLVFGVISWFFTISLQSSTRMLREAIAVQVKEKATHIKTKPINKSAAESATKRLKSKAIKS